MLELARYTTEVTEICRRLDVRRLEVFGSALRSDFDETTSDVDIFYEFNGTEDLFARYMSLKRELETLFGRRVDLIKEDLVVNPFIKDQITNSPRKQLYAA